VRPVFCFGEEKTYWTSNVLEGFRMKLAERNIPPVFFLSKFGCLPFDDLDMTVVVGEPIKMPKIEKPSKEDVAKWHAVYVKALEDLFESNKAEYASEDAVLELQ
jgi:2-acylglycerol O-acyltransferase 2